MLCTKGLVISYHVFAYNLSYRYADEVRIVYLFNMRARLSMRIEVHHAYVYDFELTGIGEISK